MSIEIIATVTAFLLSIASLLGWLGSAMTAVITIALGTALVFQGFAIGAQLRRTGRHVVSRVEPESAEIGIEAIAGVVGITLGILALVNVVPVVRLFPIAAIVLGVGLIFAQCPLAEVTSGDECVTTDGHTPRGVYDVSVLASAVHAFVGMSSIVLGIVALAVPNVAVLSLVAFLAISMTMAVGCAAVGLRLAMRR